MTLRYFQRPVWKTFIPLKLSVKLSEREIVASMKLSERVSGINVFRTGLRWNVYTLGCPSVCPLLRNFPHGRVTSRVE
jgi:hypothetical protein